MNLYRPKFKDRKTGQLRQTPRWYVDLRDHHGTRQRFAGDTDKHATAELGRMLEELVRCRQRRMMPKDRVWNWLMGLAPDLQERLIKLDLAEREWFPLFCQSERLNDWVDDFETWLKTSRGKKGYLRDDTHVSCTMGRIRAIVTGCGFKTWGDIAKSKVETFLGGLDIALSTYNNYVKAFKQFCTWVVRDGRAEFSPVQYLDLVTVQQKETRRPLNADEVERLLRSTVNAPKRHGLTGYQRAVLYRVALETGFRRNELAHLTADCFDLRNARVTLAAEHCKDRRDAVQPITMALAGRLAGFLDQMGTTGPLWPIPNRSAKMLQRDAADAGLPVVDDEGRKLVFHCTRHTLRTELERARVSDGVIDAIMRHKPSGVGKTYYRHISDFEIREGIERLPEYPWPADLQPQAQKAVS